MSFQIVNTSIERNTFHVLEMDPAFAPFFEISCKPPGWSTPGVTHDGVITFVPRFSEPMKCSLHFEAAHGGLFELPIECYPKSIGIQFDPSEIDFGSVIVGEEIEREILIRNVGGLSTRWLGVLVDCDGVGQWLLSDCHGSLRGYSSSTMLVVLRATGVGAASASIRVEFWSDKDDFARFTLTIPVHAVCLGIPVYLSTERLDFGVCRVGEMYRAVIELRNRGSIPRKFEVDVPNELRHIAEFVPRSGFVQATGDVQISVKLRFSHETARIERRVEFLVAGQIQPAWFTIVADPAPVGLVLDPPSLDFGTLTTGESRAVSVRISSRSHLPCRFGFVNLPGGVSVEPFGGFGLLLPQESLLMKVIFTSALVRVHSFEITLLTCSGWSIVIPGRATVQTSPVAIEPVRLLFPATPMGERSFARVKIRNLRRDSVQFHCGEVDGFRCDPAVGRLEGGEETSLLVVFTPELVTVQPSPNLSGRAEQPESPVSQSRRKSGVASRKSRDREEEVSVAAQPSVVGQIVDPGFRYRVYGVEIPIHLRFGSADVHQQVRVDGCVVLPPVFVTSVVVNKQSRAVDSVDLGLRRIDFGAVSVGQNRVATLEIKHFGSHSQRIIGVCDCGNFEIISPAGDVKPLSSCVVRVRFSPKSSQKFVGYGRIFGGESPETSFLTLVLSGLGAAPAICLGAESVDFGHVLVGSRHTRLLQVKNAASFGLTYAYSIVHTSKRSPFSVGRSSDELGAGESGEVVVNFRSIATGAFQGDLVVAAGDDGQTRVVSLRGGVWGSPVFVSGGVEEDAIRTPWDHYLIDEPSFRLGIDVELIYPGGEHASLLVGVPSSGEEATKGKGGEFSFEGSLPPGFSVTPLKGTIESGSAVKVLVEYAPPPDSRLLMGQFVLGDGSFFLKSGDFVARLPVKVRCLMEVEIMESALLAMERTQTRMKPAPKPRRG